MRVLLVLLGVAAVTISGASGAVQRVSVERWDFEATRKSSDNWGCLNCQLSRSSAAHSGTYSAKVINRSFDWATLRLSPSVTPGKRYYFSVFFRMLNQLDGFLFHEVNLRARFASSTGSLISTLDIGVFKHERNCNCFRKLSGDFLVPDGADKLDIRLMLPEADVNYLLDDAELFEINADEAWSANADSYIASNREGEVVIAPRILSPFVPSDYTLQVKKVRDDFSFGTAVRAVNFLGDDADDLKYRQFVLDHFKMVTLENKVKWRQMEMTQGAIQYDVVERCLDILDKNGKSTRGHAVFFNNGANNPPWVEAATGENMKLILETRLNELINRFKGRFVHWDVDNELLPDTFYETGTGNPDIAQQMYFNVSDLDPSAKLFTNEYDILSRGGKFTQAYINALNDLMAAGVPIDGVGVQAHIKDGIDLAFIQRRLDDLAAVGLPIWVTELTVNEADLAVRAQGYEDMLRLLYGHPAVEGVLLWGFWDGAIYDETASLAEGPDITLNDAGKKYFDLIDSWTDDEVDFAIPSNNGGHRYSGSTGDYVAELYEQGTLIASKPFTLSPGMSLRVRPLVKLTNTGSKLAKVTLRTL